MESPLTPTSNKLKLRMMISDIQETSSNAKEKKIKRALHKQTTIKKKQPLRRFHSE